MNLYYDITKNALVSSTGALLTDFPTFAAGDQVGVTLTVKRGTVAEDLSDCVAWRGALDVDFCATTEPMVRIIDADFDLTHDDAGQLIFVVDCATAPFIAKTNCKSGLPAYLELYGFDRNGKQTRRIRMQVRASGAVDPIGGDPVPPATDNATMTWTIALMRAGFDVQFSLDGLAWVDIEPESGAKYWRFRSASAGGDWSVAVSVPKGEKGDTGEKGEKGEKGDKGDTGATGAAAPKIDYCPPFAPIVNGWEYWLDATYTRLDYLGRVRNVRKIRLAVKSANSAITGNIALVFAVSGVESAVIAVPVGATEAVYERVFSAPVYGTLAVIRKTSDPLDTLRDGTAVTAIVSSIELEY